MGTGTVGRPAIPPVVSNRLCFPLDFDRQVGEIVFVETSVRELAKRLRLSALDFPLSELRTLPQVRFGELFSNRGAAHLNYLFHLPFSGSTLLTDRLGRYGIRVLRDPAILDALFRRESSTDTALQQIVLRALNAISGGAALVLRTAGYYPEMASLLSRSEGFRSALFLWMGWPEFVLQILKDPKRCRDMRLLAEQTGAFEAYSQQPQGDAACAAKFWLRASTKILERIDAGAPIVCIPAERFFADPNDTAIKVARYLGVRAPREASSFAPLAIHSKTGVPYVEANRRAEISLLRGAFRSELDAARAVIDRSDGAAIIKRLEEAGLK